MPKWSAGTAAAMITMAGAILGGCAAQREPMVLIEPEFSYLRDGGSFLDATASVDAAAGVELANLEALGDLPVELTEPSLLRPAKSLVQGIEPELQP